MQSLAKAACGQFPGWITVANIRTSGTMSGCCDRYWFTPLLGLTLKSHPQVLCFIQLSNSMHAEYLANLADNESWLTNLKRCEHLVHNMVTNPDKYNNGNNNNQAP
jgi:Methyl-CpG binding domain